MKPDKHELEEHAEGMLDLLVRISRRARFDGKVWRVESSIDGVIGEVHKLVAELTEDN